MMSRELALAVFLLVVFLVAIAPIIFDKKLKVEGSIADDLRKLGHDYLRESPRKRRSYPRWKGPRTDERINRMLAECSVLLKELGVPISESVAPEVKLVGAHTYYGVCCPKGNRKNYTEYDYYIELSGYAIDGPEKFLRNVLIHELLHTVPNGLTHTGEWKKWAEFVSDRTEYHIQRCAEDVNAPDLYKIRFQN